ncbi:alpha/beta hydrolase [Rhodococcus sp. H29-C3]|uniref:alpha/beta hydrolase n=1 Tax=Rhodococcus sp. H29-C3 TaxID=3046307 RepID=UPI0024B991D2|nr:alpha/beta hydrolase [Rhodococcus sp. H29-C3]MDJ0359893.1 alpha/beta hydrolase [Rhodococcus sp. H29-C3]
MVTWSDIRRWDPEKIGLLADSLIHTSDVLMGDMQALERLSESLEWTGAAADAARTEIYRLHDEYICAADQLMSIGRCVEGLTYSMYPLVASVLDCDRDARESDADIDDDGGVVDRMPLYSSASEDAWSLGRDRLRRIRDLRDRATELLTRARYLDSQGAAILRTLSDSVSATGADVSTVPAAAPASRIAVPTETALPTGKSASANAAFWDSLTMADRTRLLVDRPELIGNLDGIPAVVRDAANRRMLVRERSRLEEAAADLQDRLNDNIFGGMLDNADAGLAQTHKRLAALDAITTTLDQGDRQLLVLDNRSGEDTLAAIAVGNVDTATHVAVFVPGLDSDVQGDLRRYDGDIDSLKMAVEQLLPADPPETAACVTWMNYEAPHLGWNLLNPDRSVVSGSAAIAGGERLSTFLDGLDAARAEDPHLSLLGHSYGSLTAAYGVRGADDTGVDDLVVVGSPGLGTGTVAELSVPPGHVFVGEASDDRVADLGAFGTDPSRLEGTAWLPTEGSAYLPVEGHGGYFVEGTTAQHNSALVVAGRASEIAGG